MVTHLDSVRTANTLIKQHGYEAALEHAHEMFDKFTDNDDVKGAAVWLGIIADIKMLHAGQGGQLN